MPEIGWTSQIRAYVDAASAVQGFAHAHGLYRKTAIPPTVSEWADRKIVSLWRLVAKEAFGTRRARTSTLRKCRRSPGEAPRFPSSCTGGCRQIAASVHSF